MKEQYLEEVTDIGTDLERSRLENEDDILVYYPHADLAVLREVGQNVDKNEIDDIIAFHATDPAALRDQLLGKKVVVTKTHLNVPKGTRGRLIGFDQADEYSGKTAMIEVKPLKNHADWPDDPKIPWFKNQLKPEYRKSERVVFVEMKHLKPVKEPK